MNDTVREVGGALGVAVLGSVLASRYTGAISSTTAALPADAAHRAGDSLGGAVLVAQQVGGSTGGALLDAARTAYVDGFGLALMIAAVVAAAGAAVAAIWLRRAPSSRKSSTPTSTSQQTSQPSLPPDAHVLPLLGPGFGPGRVASHRDLRGRTPFATDAGMLSRTSSSQVQAIPADAVHHRRHDTAERRPDA